MLGGQLSERGARKLWGRILSCGPISNRPSCNVVRAVRGRLKIGLQDKILPHGSAHTNFVTPGSARGLTSRLPFQSSFSGNSLSCELSACSQVTCWPV